MRNTPDSRQRLLEVVTGSLIKSGGAHLRIRLLKATSSMEDVAFSKRMRKWAPPLLIKEPVTTSSRRWRESGVLRTILKMWALRFAYFIGVSPQHLWHYYYGDD